MPLYAPSVQTGVLRPTLRSVAGRLVPAGDGTQWLRLPRDLLRNDTKQSDCGWLVLSADTTVRMNTIGNRAAVDGWFVAANNADSPGLFIAHTGYNSILIPYHTGRLLVVNFGYLAATDFLFLSINGGAERSGASGGFSLSGDQDSRLFAIGSTVAVGHDGPIAHFSYCRGGSIPSAAQRKEVSLRLMEQWGISVAPPPANPVLALWDRGNHLNNYWPLWTTSGRTTEAAFTNSVGYWDRCAGTIDASQSNGSFVAVCRSDGLQFDTSDRLEFSGVSISGPLTAYAVGHPNSNLHFLAGTAGPAAWTRYGGQDYFQVDSGGYCQLNIPAVNGLYRVRRDAGDVVRMAATGFAETVAPATSGSVSGAWSPNAIGGRPSAAQWSSPGSRLRSILVYAADTVADGTDPLIRRWILDRTGVDL